MSTLRPERLPGPPRPVAPGPRRPGFTLVELLVVLLMVALASGLIALTLRSGDEDRLEQEAMRLSALLEAGRAEARANGMAVRFELLAPGDPAGQRGSGSGSTEGAAHFRFVGLPEGILPQVRWLDDQTSARIDGARGLRLGPEPLIGAQRIVLLRGERQVVLATDGLSPFAVQLPEAGNGAPAATR